ncbi:MAG: glycosyltransferase family 2 protein [Porphyromonadaceae bacterium]|nr:glycosyltransferase family 2 protein [Porphyromonadaceae bacterium]
MSSSVRDVSLAIIIVSYRVPLLVEQCLEAVEVATLGLPKSEVWVVDNASGDGSVEYLKAKFPEVRYIENAENVGFSRANNQAIRETSADFILLLNPDTIITSTSLRESIDEMLLRPRCGALGLRMYDIRGRYLRESKRGFPTPWASFCRFVGLCSLFPHSSRFAHYYMGHLSDDEPQCVEVLIGAYMFMRRSVLDKVGLLDEDFFMYGEDIDLSYRIHLAGYECRYLPIPMIHYKGESSALNSERYIRSFYGAMKIFYAKYYPDTRYILGRLFIGCAIEVVACLSRLRSRLRSGKTKINLELIPLALETTEGWPEYGSHVLVDKRCYSYDDIVCYIVRNAHRGYVYHFLGTDGRVISPKA